MFIDLGEIGSFNTDKIAYIQITDSTISLLWVDNLNPGSYPIKYPYTGTKHIRINGSFYKFYIDDTIVFLNKAVVKRISRYQYNSNLTHVELLNTEIFLKCDYIDVLLIVNETSRAC